MIRTYLTAAAVALAALCAPAHAQTSIGSYASKLCASEGRVCYVRQYPAVVIYATPAAQVAKVVNTPVPCTNAYWGDPAKGIVKSCYAVVGLYAIPPGVPVATDPVPTPPDDPASTPTNPTTPPSASASAPVILNASPTARAGDYVSVQGSNFGATPTLWLDSSTAASLALPITNKVGDTWLAARIPTTATGALSLRAQNDAGPSAAVKINAARAYHLDAMQIVPTGKVRIFGRNLVLPNSTPVVTFAGTSASIDIGASNEHMLVATVPSGLVNTSSVAITVDNGNGSGPSALDRTIAVVAGPSGDSFNLGIGWAASLTASATRVINTATDSRLATKVKCDGATNDAPAVTAAVQLAQSLGGAVVKLPAGVCAFAGGVQMASNVVIQGAGKTVTTVRYSGSGNPLYGGSIDSAGLADLTLANAGAAPQPLLLHDSTRVFLQNVRFAMGTSDQMFLTNNRNFAVNGCDFIQTGAVSDHGPFLMGGSRGVVFTNNTIALVAGGTSFASVSDAFIGGNHWTRDGSYPQTDSTVIHMLVVDFAARLAIIGNTFDVVNGPISPVHNDGETILTEGGGGSRTENTGTVQAATATTLVDGATALNVDPLGTGSIPENYGVAIVGGKGAGQTRRIASYAGSTITVDAPWAVIPDTSSQYATMVWGLERSLIKGNTLTGNPRGIQLYQTGIRDVDIIGNTLTDNGTIMLRAYQSQADHQFMPIYGVKIAGNVVNNSAAHTTPAAIGAVFTNHDGGNFGTAIIGLDISGNAITAARPNIVGSSLFDYVNTDGYTVRMQVESGSYDASTEPRILGALLRGNTCAACDVAFRLATGSNGAVLVGNTLTASPTLWTNASSAGGELATDTVVVDSSITPPPVTTPVTDPTTPAITWTQVAVDNATFTVPGGFTRTVRYGNVAHNLWSLKNVTGSGTCSTAFFGDDPVNPAAVWGAPKICQVASTLTPIPPTVTTSTTIGMAGAPLINLSLIPPDGTATSKFNVTPTTEKPGVGGGEFRTLCTFSHMTFDDPIVFPGAAGAAHLHSFFGNSDTSATSTPESVRTTGKSTCRGGIANRSAYWVPTMIDVRDGTPLVPKYFEPYYKNSVYMNDVHHLPPGLRMISGNHTATSNATAGAISYKCIGGPNNQNSGYIKSIPNCDKGAEMWMQVFFPQCWDGVHLDSADHKSHMAFVQTVNNRFVCPADHPVALPAITFNVVYLVPTQDATTHWRLSSDKYPADQPAGFSGHGDWFNGWDPSVSDAWVDNCIRAVVDCHGNLTGDGRTMN